jgi:AcrR family transcriptional regulator
MKHRSKTTRLTAQHRRDQIIAAAQRMSYGGKLYDWTVQDVANKIGVSRATVCHYFASTKGLRSKIILQAIRQSDVDIVIQALVKTDPLCKGLPDALYQACREAL